MKDSIVRKITNSSKRKSLYHFTRVRNLPSIAHLNALYAPNEVDPTLSDGRRIARREIQYQGHPLVANAHLRISEQMMDPGTTLHQFYHHLDQHVFLWPTQRDCLKMLEMYSRREPDEAFAVLQLDAYSLIYDYYDAVKLSKYDSGSSPRFPHRCSYRKSLRMFLPVDQFEKVSAHDVPTKPSEIREVLVEDQVRNLSRYLQAIYGINASDVKVSWGQYARSFTEFTNESPDS
ncbi:hypothetical protein [Paenibacillus sp. CF384]|uniref:DUF7002 family protein n=1 Tax=Paenibacillus sp. CF384 TaxID=1884382 RepID=UPI00089CE2E8|nr:hypothetical protein [Paenibacillus sp. CF384]SDW03355.1 hypothetical protein SAMN05518855_100126 [Paenibacillus sp. CF384]